MALTLTPDQLWDEMVSLTNRDYDSYAAALADVQARTGQLAGGFPSASAMQDVFYNTDGLYVARWVDRYWPLLTTIVSVYGADAADVPDAVSNHCLRRVATFLRWWEDAALDDEHRNIGAKVWVRSGAAALFAPYAPKRVLST